MTRHITTVRIKGFQSHADTTLHFIEGVNAITGPTDNGKSAVLRALQWWAWNKAPEGDWMRKGCTLASVEVTLSDGIVVTRERNAGRNRYVVTAPGTKPESYADFGRKPPKEVLKAHGMLPVEFEKDSATLLNIATQLESPFFLTASPTMRAKILSKLAGVEVIDRAISNANKDILAHGRDMKITAEQLATTETELAEYANLDEQSQRLERVRTVLAELEPLSQRLGQARLLRNRLAQIDAGIRDTEATLERTRYADEAGRLLTQVEGLQRQRLTLTQTNARYISIARDLTATEATVKRYTNLPAAEQTLTALLKHAETLANLRRIAKAKNSLVTPWTETVAEIKRLKGVPQALELVGTLEAQHARREHLKTLRLNLKATDAGLASADQALTAATKQLRAETPFRSLTSIGEQRSTLAKTLIRLRQIDARIAAEKRAADQAEQDLTAVSDEYGRMLQDAGLCPTCGQSITEHVAAQIAAELHGEVIAHVG